MATDYTRLVADLTRELTAADLIIRQMKESLRAAHLDRSFTLRTRPRVELIAAVNRAVARDEALAALVKGGH